MGCDSFPFSRAMQGVRTLSPYQPGKPVSDLQRELGIRDIVKLASNENPLGPSPRVLEAVREAVGGIARYPDGSGHALRHALAAHHDIDAACITLGNGSNDVLDLIARAFLGPGREAVFSEHAFAVYPIATQLAGATARVAAACDGLNGQRHGHDLAALRALVTADTGVVFIANPNNPTGTWLTEAPLRDFIAALPPECVVVLDEAYVEYADVPGYVEASGWLAVHPNLVVVRTFSKAYGLAGLRVGYALSSPAIADLLNRVRQPFNVNSLALVAAEAALADPAHVAASASLNRRERERLARELAARDVEVVPSAGNFLLAGFGRPARALYDGLLREGVIVRPVENYGLPDHLRITVGLPAENGRFLDALDRVRGRAA